MSPSRHDSASLERRAVGFDHVRSQRVRSQMVRMESAGDEVLRQKPQLDSLTDELSDISDLEAMHQVESMHLDGPDADPELLRDFAVRQTLNDEGKNLFLPRRDGTGRARDANSPPHEGARG
jgi:hypothetical protein